MQQPYHHNVELDESSFDKYRKAKEASFQLDVPVKSRYDIAPYSTLKTAGGRKLRVFDFPTDLRIGDMWIYSQHSTSFTNRKETAKGRIEVDVNDYLTFVPSSDVEKYPQYLKRFKPGDVNAITIDHGLDCDALLAACTAIPGIDKITLEGKALLTNKCIGALNQFKSLTNLNAIGTTLSGNALARATCWANLREFSFSLGREASAILEKLKSSQHLEKLVLANCNLTYQDFKAISTISNLKILVISQNKITKNQLTLLTNLKSLTELEVTDCGLDESWIPILVQMKGLRRLAFITPTTRSVLRDKIRAAMPNVILN